MPPCLDSATNTYPQVHHRQKTIKNIKQEIGSSIILKLLSQCTPQIFLMPLICIKQTFTLKKLKRKKIHQLSTPLLPFALSCTIHFSSIKYSLWWRSHPTPFHPRLGPTQIYISRFQLGTGPTTLAKTSVGMLLRDRLVINKNPKGRLLITYLSLVG